MYIAINQLSIIEIIVITLILSGMIIGLFRLYRSTLRNKKFLEEWEKEIIKFSKYTNKPLDKILNRE